MKKSVFCFCMMMLVTILSGCNKKEVQYDFMQKQSEISMIEIVRVGEMDGQGLNAQEVLYSVRDNDSFITKFNQVPCYKRVGDPVGVSPEQIAIKICYSNGEYELIGRTGQARYTLKNQYVNHIGYRYFDKEKFYDLINYYLENADAP